MPLTAEAAATDHRFVQAFELARCGRVAELRRDLSTALRFYTKARSLIARAPATPLHANLLRWSGSVLRDVGRIDEADRLYRESYEVANASGAPGAMASALKCTAVVAQRRGHVVEAIALYGRANRLAKEAGQVRLVGMIQQNLGVLAHLHGEVDEALERYRDALAAFEELGDEEPVSWVLNNIGSLLADRGLLDRAQEAFARGLSIARNRGDVALEGILRSNYAECLTGMECLDAAREEPGTAFTIDGQGKGRGREGHARRLLGSLEIARNHVDEADLYLGQALEMGHEVLEPLLVAEGLDEGGELPRSQGRYPEPLEEWEGARRHLMPLDAVLDGGRVATRVAARRQHRVGEAGG